MQSGTQSMTESANARRVTAVHGLLHSGASGPSTTALSEPKRLRLVSGVLTALFVVTCILALFTAMECHQVNSVRLPNYPWGASLLYGAALWFWWAAAGCLLWTVTARQPWLLRLDPGNILLQTGVGLGFTALHLLTMHAVVWLTPFLWPITGLGTDGSLQFFVPARISLDFLVYAFLWTTYAVMRFHMQAQRDTVNALAMERQLSEAKLRALQTQMEPHFLFNTLNAIATLVELGRQQQASAMLAHLNVILRITLARSSPLKVPVSQELEVIQNYLAIEQIRFADRLRVEMRVESAALDGMVPCFLLQPLVENAVRHGTAQREEDGVLQTFIARVGDTLQMRIRDNGPGLRSSADPGHGVGLRNTSERLAHFYPEQHAMRIVEPESGGVEVEIVIPFESVAR